MSPVSVKLGDFGVSKWIPAEAATTFHTQVSTQVYSAPEVQGLDSNSETSNYTNSVDIWSLGCVIYELLVGTRLFRSEAQVSRYYFGKRLFPEDELKALLPPIDDVGISLLKSMLMIRPEDRPTATDALENSWLTSLKSDNEESGGATDERTQGRDGSMLSKKRKNRVATYNEPRKKSERGSITEGGTKCIPGRADFWVDTGSKIGGDLPIAQSSFDASVMTLSDTAPTESLVVQTGSRKSEIVSHNFRSTHSKSPNRMRKKQAGNTPQICHQSRTQNTTLTLLTKLVTNMN